MFATIRIERRVRIFGRWFTWSTYIPRAPHTKLGPIEMIRWKIARWSYTPARARQTFQ